MNVGNFNSQAELDAHYIQLANLRAQRDALRAEIAQLIEKLRNPVPPNAAAAEQRIQELQGEVSALSASTATERANLTRISTRITSINERMQALTGSGGPIPVTPQICGYFGS